MPGRVFPFSMEKDEKDRYLTGKMIELIQYHRDHCSAYRKMTDALGCDLRRITHYSQLPYLPVSLFKDLRLSSLEEGEDDFKTVTSSGTSGQRRSQIILDARTRTDQQTALARIGSDFLGTRRMPYLVIDCPATVGKRDHFSARTSGILGFSIFGAHRTFALNDDMCLNKDALHDFLEKYGRQPFLVFGFTFMVWKYFCQELEAEGMRPDMRRAVLVHGGGWKKLADQAVSKEAFAAGLGRVCGISRVIDYYGMAEQTGSIFFECECGHLHCSDYSGILFRRPEDFSVCGPGEEGIIEVLSTLPRSYPGHILLTEDQGRLLGIDDCPCGRAGAYFEVSGRIEHAELRGCSDTYEDRS